ncbi:uncharacterized protein LOC134705993 [Mytilus trossulus]|uniref:uncharacterized protein LOC134705993 n=1 Tax=Mytilus trossulus TaxID=6551 RepID=UPI003004BC83
MADNKLCAGCHHQNEDIKAESWCSACSELVCQSCASAEERMFSPHKVVPMKEIQQLSFSLLELFKNCKNYPDQTIALFCCQHDKVICGLCVPVLHQNCKPIISIENAARCVKYGTAISDVERRMDNLSKVKDNILGRTEITFEDLKKSRNSIKKRVSDIQQKVIDHLHKIEADIHKDIDKNPECITLYDNSHAVSSLCDDGIQIIDLTTLKLNRIVKVDGICRGITSVKDKIIVKNHSNISTIVDINGKVLNTIQTTFDPDDICANEDGDVYCTDYNSHKVFVVTSNGKEREIYSGPDLRDCRGMAVDDRGDVYVAGGKSNNIHRISYDGKKT